MNWLYKAERKFGRYAIHNLMYYIIGIMVMGVLIGLYDQTANSAGRAGIYMNYLCLDFAMIAKGQVWRLVTFLLAPSGENIFFTAIMLFLYYSIGNTLEQVWGSFKFNIYYLSGIILTILAGLFIYLSFSSDFSIAYYMPQGLEFVNQSIFLAFAFMFPDTQFLLFFIIPIKARWLGFAYLAMTAFQAYQYISMGAWPFAVYLVISIANFFVFFLMTRNYQKISPSQMKRKAKFKAKVHAAKTSGPKHKCSVCGRTEEDDPMLEFRYCSKCEGNYEYCQDHLFTHEHVRRK